MTKKVILREKEVLHVSELAKLMLSQKECRIFLPQLSAIINFVSKLQKINTKGVVPTSQVTGLVNVFREDKIDKSRILSQKTALKNKEKTHNGYFIVPAVFGE